MKPKFVFFVNIILALVVGCTMIAFSNSTFLRRFELAGLDILFRLRGEQAYSENICIIEIQDEDIIKVGRWPWDRTWHAALVRALDTMGAKQVYFDMLFSEPSANSADDLAFAAAMKEADNVYLPFVYFETVDKINILRPIKLLDEHNKGLGGINVYPDIDGSLRRLSMNFRYGDRVYNHMALKLAQDFSSYRVEEISDYGIVMDNYVTKLKIPFINKDNVLVNWRGRWAKTYQHYSFLDILKAYNEIEKGREPQIDLKAIENSICLVGLTAIGLYDIKPVPVEPAYPSIGVIANVIDNVLNDNFIHNTPLWLYYLLIFVLAFIPAILVAEENAYREIFYILGITVFFLITYFTFFFGVWIPYVVPLLSLFICYVVTAAYNFTRVTAEKVAFQKLSVTDELTQLYNIRYFNMLLKSEVMVASNDKQRYFCLLMGIWIILRQLMILMVIRSEILF